MVALPAESISGHLFGVGLDPWVLTCDMNGNVTRPKRAVWYDRFGDLRIRFTCPTCGRPHDHSCPEIATRMELMWEWGRI